jgi:hypothetical protein
VELAENASLGGDETHRKKFTTKFVVAFKGWSYFFKKQESQDRATKPFQKFQAGKFSEAWRVCDCLSKLIIFEMLKDPASYGERVLLCARPTLSWQLCALNIVNMYIGRCRLFCVYWDRKKYLQFCSSFANSFSTAGSPGRARSAEKSEYPPALHTAADVYDTRQQCTTRRAQHTHHTSTVTRRTAAGKHTPTREACEGAT